MAYVHYLALCVLLTYAITCSALFIPLRVVATRFGMKSAVFIHCPNCVGFWIALGCAWLYPSDVIWERFVFGPALFIAMLQVAHMIKSDFLISPTAEEEMAMLDEVVDDHAA